MGDLPKSNAGYEQWLPRRSVELLKRPNFGGEAQWRQGRFDFDGAAPNGEVLDAVKRSHPGFKGDGGTGARRTVALNGT